ncbi:MAG: hypothetical protein H6737_20470 [Alphaproteobacteria bacterium]|nr:hypothetical protein [Alphaproteobacteria bacterium]
MKLLVTGFGPFLDVRDNPAARVARAVDGASGPGFRVVGREIPVSYARAVEETVRHAREHGVDCVLGVGVAGTRTAPELERFGRARLGQSPDVDGVCAPRLPGPDVLESSLDVVRWAGALGCHISEDAGGYVCNAWLHQVRQRLDVPVGFLHVPPDGIAASWLIAGLARLVTSADAP